MNKQFIGIGGVARAGKDTACNIILNRLGAIGISAKRVALADSMKQQIRSALIKNYSIDILNCTPEEKEIVRPELVAFGKVKRVFSKGKFWTELLESSLNTVNEQVIVVPDIRYDFYPEDERFWLQTKQKGILLHVARYTDQFLAGRSWITPPNKDEAENDPKLRAKADFILEWESGDVNTLGETYKTIFDKIVNSVTNKLEKHNG